MHRIASTIDESEEVEVTMVMDSQYEKVKFSDITQTEQKV